MPSECTCVRTAQRAGAALTTFNKANVDLSPQIIAHRSTATRGQMLVNPPFWAEFGHKSTINDKVGCQPPAGSFCDSHAAGQTPFWADCQHEALTATGASPSFCRQVLHAASPGILCIAQG